MVYRSPVISLCASLLLSVAAQTVPAAEVVAPPPPEPTAAEQRLEAYDQFRSNYNAARYEEALPFAQRVVELSEADPDRDFELPVAYNNLGATQFQLGLYAAAEESYVKSLEILESTQGISSRRMVVPLAGLGGVYAAIDQRAKAAEYFARALAVSRRSDGLFNLQQLPLIDQAADNLFRLNDFNGVEHELLYALRIADQNYGYLDERSLPAVMRLAKFYEALREYNGARMMYMRARDINQKESGGYSPAAISNLIGIARTHRLQHTMAPETIEEQHEARGQVIGFERSGLKSIKTALELLRSTADPPKQLLVDTLTELGDWYQATSRPDIAQPYYVEAASIPIANPDADIVNPLVAPRMISYRAPLASGRDRSLLEENLRRRTALFVFRVSAAGEPQQIRVEATDMSEAQLAQTQRSLARAIYSPRFEDGRAVATEDVRFTGEWKETEVPQQPTASSSGG